jgi:hypothetical protein
VPDFQKILSPTQTSDQPEQDLNVLSMQGSQAQTPEAPTGRESILPNMSLLELHEQFQLLDDDEKSFVRDSLEFGFRHHRNRRDLTSGDGMERQRRMTYNSDATFGDSMWEDEEEEQDIMDEEMKEEGSAIPPVALDVAHVPDLGRDSRYYEEPQDEIDLTARPEKKLSSIEEKRFVILQRLWGYYWYHVLTTVPFSAGIHYRMLQLRHRTRWSKKKTCHLILGPTMTRKSIMK